MDGNNKDRQMIWTCRKCKSIWTSPIIKHVVGNQENRPDAEQETICDDCLDRMTNGRAQERT